MTAEFRCDGCGELVEDIDRVMLCWDELVIEAGSRARGAR